MSGKRVCGWLVLALLFNGHSAEAVTRTYEAVVTYSFGPHSDLFPAGRAVVVSYSLNSLAKDSNSDPRRGSFGGAVLSLSVSFPSRPIFAVAGPSGSVQTFDNAVEPSGRLSDQVFFYGGPISSASLLDGEPITSLEVDFLSDFVAPSKPPSMLTSDALPLSMLPVIDAVVFFQTRSGYTQVNFAAAPVGPPGAVPLTSANLPGFRFWVRISDSRFGTLATPCPGGTLCVAGAIANRAELFVRIDGPKGNGRLWPSIIKFNTTKTEVWIQQIKTGDTRYYLLPPLSQDSESLPGLVDKTGFPP